MPRAQAAELEILEKVATASAASITQDLYQMLYSHLDHGRAI